MSPTVTDFKVVTLGSSNVFYPGQTLKGQVIIHVAEDLKLKGLRVTMRGCGRVAFHVGKMHPDRTENYMKRHITIFGKERGEAGEVTLPAGQHTLPFEIKIRTGIPPSFEPHMYVRCYVRYWLVAVVDHSSHFGGTKECKKYFTVGSVVDLNTVPRHSAPVTKTLSGTMFCGGCCEAEKCAKYVCCCCCFCESGPLTIAMTTNKTAFVPGEAIVVNTDISNDSDKDVQWTNLQLLMLITVKAEYGRLGIEGKYVLRKTVKKVVDHVSHGVVSMGEKTVYTDRLHVSPVPPSGLPGCELIDVKYLVELTVQTTCSVMDRRLQTTVLIGTVPLRSAAQRARFAQQALPRVPITQQPTASDPSLATTRLPPPSYRECIFGAHDVQDEDPETSRRSSFAPSYHYYPWMSGKQTDGLPSYDKLYSGGGGVKE